MTNTIKSTTYAIQYGNDWLNDYLVFTQYTDSNNNVVNYTLVNQNGAAITDFYIIEAAFDYVNNLAE